MVHTDAEANKQFVKETFLCEGCVDTKRPKDSAVLDQSAKYYHLTHDELIGLLLQRERELSQRDEHVQELESYIDRLLVRIMETSPTLLQISPGPPK